VSDKKYTTDIDKPITEVEINKYYLVIGTEANATYAYQNAKVTFSSKIAKHQYLTGPNLDWGHAFFYIVENDDIFSFFSFGPSAGKKLGDNKIIGNASTCQYPISEVTQLYVLDINVDEAKKIRNEVKRMYENTNNQFYNNETSEWEQKEVNDKKYRAITNETCAKEAYRILSSILNDKIPNAYGYVKMYGISKKAICPFAWNEHLSNSNLKHYSYPEYPNVGKAKELLAAFKLDNEKENENLKYTYYLRTPSANSMGYGVMVPEFDPANTTDWFLIEGDEDPLKIYSYFNG